MATIKPTERYTAGRAVAKLTKTQSKKISDICKKYQCSVADWIRHKIDEEKL